MRHPRTLVTALLLATLAACGGSDGGGGRTFAVDNLTFHGTTLVVAAAQYDGAKGVLFAADPADPSRVATGPDPLSTDVVLRVAGDVIYALNRSDSNLQLLDPAAGLATGTSQFSTGAGANPHDLVVIDGRAYVSRYGLAALWVLNPTTGEELATIDLSRYADADQIPEMDQMTVWEGKLLLSLQLLDEENWFTPTDHSTVAVIDPATNEVSATFDLQGVNPASRFASDGAHLYLATTGSWGVADGGVERIAGDLSGSTTIVSGAELDGDLSDLAIVSATKGYVLVSGLDWSNPDNRVVAFNPTTGAVGATVYHTAAYLPEIDASADGTLLAIADRDPAGPGVVLLDTATDQPLTTTPINDAHRLPPASMVFLP